MEFCEWLTKQDISKWYEKHKNKKTNAKNYAKVTCHLTLREYMYKAWEAGINDISQINQNGFHLSRKGDKGDYTVESCRFIPCSYNWNEMTRTPCPGERNGRAILTEESAVLIYTSNKSIVQIAKLFKCSTQTVKNIKNRKQWKLATMPFWTMNDTDVCGVSFNIDPELRGFRPNNHNRILRNR